MSTKMTTLNDPTLSEMVDLAPWDDSGSPLSGADIWGTSAPFAQLRANRFFTRENAEREIARYRDGRMWDELMGDRGPWHAQAQ